MENYPSICLQAHMDMVCIKEELSNHDFTKDPIEMVIDGDYISANQTSLGADDATGICTMLSILENTEPHGPLEFFITTDEEQGNIGASKCIQNQIKSQYLINLDTERLNQIFVGCVARIRQTTQFDLIREPILNVKYLSIDCKNMRGGHSGEEIHLKIINAIKMFFDVLYNLIAVESFNISLIDVNGGTAMNSIPSFCKGTIAVQSNQFEQVIKVIKKMEQDYINEYQGFDTPTIQTQEITVRPLFDPILKERSDEIIFGYNAMFNGMNVYDTHSGYSQTSTNVGIIQTTNESINTTSYIRSPYETAALRIFNYVDASIRLAHGTTTNVFSLPAWHPMYDNNPLLEMYKKEYQKSIGQPPKVTSCAGGLEVAYLLQRNKNIKHAIACGPDIIGAHTTREKVSIASVRTHYNLVKQILRNSNKLKIIY